MRTGYAQVWTALEKFTRKTFFNDCRFIEKS